MGGEGEEGGGLRPGGGGGGDDGEVAVQGGIVGACEGEAVGDGRVGMSKRTASVLLAEGKTAFAEQGWLASA